MNHLMIIGNVTRDSELRTTPNGVNVCSFSVAVNERRGKNKEQQATFFRVTAWNKLAETCGNYVKKGMKIAVSGRVEISTYQTQKGEQRSELAVQADEVEFLTRVDNNGGANSQYEEAQAPEPENHGQNFVDVSSEVSDELPF